MCSVALHAPTRSTVEGSLARVQISETRSSSHRLASATGRFTWSFVHLAQQAFAERRRGPADHAVGPALTDGLQQEGLGPRGLDQEVGELKDALGGGDGGPSAPAKRDGDV